MTNVNIEKDVQICESIEFKKKELPLSLSASRWDCHNDEPYPG